TLSGTSAPPTFTNQKLRPDAVHTGDICTLGIFCLGDDDRDLADVNDIKIDSTGGAQIAYTWEDPGRTRTEIDFQCQTSGPGLLAGATVRSCQAAAVGGTGAGAAGGTLPATGRSPALAALGIALLAAAASGRRVSRARR